MLLICKQNNLEAKLQKEKRAESDIVLKNYKNSH